MPTHNTYIYILIMALVTYLVRVLPLTLIRKEIKNITVKSFLYYVPYVTLAIIYCRTCYNIFTDTLI